MAILPCVVISILQNLNESRPKKEEKKMLMDHDLISNHIFTHTHTHTKHRSYRITSLAKSVSLKLTISHLLPLPTFS